MNFNKLTLYSNNLHEQQKFYLEKLDLKGTSSTDSLTIKLPHGELEFKETHDFKPYHFAFTIPGSKISEALEWLKERVKILKNGSDEVVDFPAWNAESIYFYDADGNIVEFIARKNLPYDTEVPFDSHQLIEISEIGVATSDFEEKFKQLTAIPGVEKFGGGDAVFCAIGEETGLFILIDKNRKDWFPGNDKAFSANFTTLIGTSEGEFRVVYIDDKLIFQTA